MLAVSGVFVAIMGATTFRESAERRAQLTRGNYPVIQAPDYSNADMFVRLGIAVFLLSIVILIFALL